jgi:hypothetical protein
VHTHLPEIGNILCLISRIRDISISSTHPVCPDTGRRKPGIPSFIGILLKIPEKTEAVQ